MDSQLSNSQDEPVPAVEEEWQIISANWWRTSFSSISWSYEPEKALQNLVYAKPPHYHLSLYNKREKELSDEEGADDVPSTPSEWHSSSSCRIAGQDDVLNEELIGVKGVSDVLRAYEKAVGFDHSPQLDLSLEDVEKRAELRADWSEEDVQLGKERWQELVEDLIGGLSLQELLKEARRKPKTMNHSPESRLAPPKLNVDYFFQPSTPKPFRLNPSASSFVPLGSPTSTFSSSSCSSSSSDSPDRFVSFSFPASNRSFSPSATKKDHQGYVHSLPSRSRTTSSDSSCAAGNDRPSSNFLPPFLFEPANQRRRPTRTSRTRTIVDRLRSQHHQDVPWSSPASQDPSPTISDFGAGNLNYFKSRLSDDGAVGGRSSACPTTPPLTEEERLYNERVGVVGWSDNVEGWTIPPAPVPVDPETKRTRSKELLMTLRRRTDSLTSNATSPANLLAARSLGVALASTPSVILDPERLVESPEPAEHTLAEAEANTHYLEEEDDLWAERLNQHQGTNPRSTFPTSRHSSRGSVSSTLSNVPGSPRATYAHALTQPHTQRDIRNQNQTPSHAQAFPKPIKPAKPAKHPTGYLTSPSTGIPYTVLGLPLSMSGVHVNMPVAMSVPGMPVTMTMGAAHAAMQVPMSVPMQVPVQVPVQSMQYSTLMHLRIMQQMQMMRNSMGLSGGVAGATAGVTR